MKPYLQNHDGRGTLEEAKARGRGLGAAEAKRNFEVDEQRADRISAAERYAVWDWQGRPISGEPLPLSEFFRSQEAKASKSPKE